MKKINSKRGRLVLLGLSASAVAAFAPIGGGSATAQAPVESAQITIEGAGKNLDFSGPKTVARGQELEIVNDTNPKQDGPHTFSLVKDRFIPKTREEQKKCDICFSIAKAHKLNFKTGEVRKDSVDKGAEGWNRMFNDEKSGDTWYTEKRNDSQSRVVSAKVGKTLTYMCAVHPFMRGKIEVVE